jgi:diadenosine tetraphosphatase ApaH/serine/threonine PP2A family protein phosphatase
LERVVTDARELTDVSWREDEGRRYLLNPGSVGQPRDGDPRASYAIIDTHDHAMSWHRVSYDLPTAQRKIRAAKLPPFLADRLALGR